MDLEEGIKRINGTVKVEIQGFFTERYINLCKINNVKIWDVQNIAGGIVRFTIAIKDFKKLKSITKRTKCKLKILNKKGLYFKLFKYRKRRLVILLLASFFILCIIANSFVWNIEIVGNNYIETQRIENALKESGLYVGKNKIGFKSKDVTNNIRVLEPDISWIGIDIEGTKAIVKVVEKTKIKKDNNLNKIGDIVSDKSGTIVKLVVENGTAIPNVGDYIEEGRILIEGKIYSKYMDVKDVRASGTIVISKEYEYEREYSYKTYEKEYTDKPKYSIGLTINNNEFYINYLDKSLSYDIIKEGSSINIFGNNISFDLYKFNIYNNIEIEQTKEDIIELAKKEAEEYINAEVLPNCINGAVENSNAVILNEDEDKINIKVVYTIIQEIGCFKERI